MPVTIEQVYEALKECYDPEIPINIVDLGLIYDVQIKEAKVDVKMTATQKAGYNLKTLATANSLAVLF